MANSPSVCCICLTSDRQALTERAVRCFLRQTYEPKMLLVLDTGRNPFMWVHTVFPAVAIVRAEPKQGDTIGLLRNEANKLANGDIIAHWDDDDWSHPERIAEQVELLQSSGAEAVGYHDMLFWSDPPNQTWLYQNAPGGNPRYALGTSLCYWRSTWNRVPFEDVTVGEDLRWIDQVKVHSIRSLKSEPQMIAAIHGGNISSRVDESSTNWVRVPHWDNYCKRIMALHADHEQAAQLQRH